MAIADNTTNPHAWTDDQIRAAPLFPRPQGAVDKAWAYEVGRDEIDAEPISPERRLLEHILEHGDYMKTAASEECPSGTWLLVPLTWTLIETLEQFEAARADLEGDNDREAEIAEQDTCDDEPDHDSDENCDNEPNGSPMMGWVEPLPPPDPAELLPVYQAAEEFPVRGEFRPL